MITEVIVTTVVGGVGFAFGFLINILAMDRRYVSVNACKQLQSGCRDLREAKTDAISDRVDGHEVWLKQLDERSIAMYVMLAALCERSGIDVQRLNGLKKGPQVL